ncbi:NADPH:quinone oxidoreductase family protein [Mumia sp. zg.B53]|uniref:NADPH:quinone oxidoreductase family protein n=1 Tax=unclassified Mumia TaxID=2621872 RepID=UPI001C6E1375|nr:MULTISPECIES: NADPH:quinone oxidoreductase family protein [unclassified Mumia]MBW9209572.1 NADPH:quinone oxidoreductase family protein [Mumia sp. zg.B21]MBW9214177.1 NADPH:quinone oxidoreductase family protein [Mumia sp. zg.B53]MDD9348329.1 NADPH:quinone oxidoreductase family protein [Mumia sp.]
MRAVQITSLEGPSAVEVVDIDAPEPGPEQIVIDVKASGVSFPEVLQTRGLYQLKPPLPFVPGSEVAGEVVSAPSGSGFSTGDRVAAFPMLGGFAERAVSGVDMTFHLPDNVSYEEGAGVPLNYLTAHFALLKRGHLRNGESVLVQGAAGGVGTASIQVAKAYGAGQVIAVTSTDAKGEVAVAAGADSYVLADGFKEAVKDLTGGHGVDLVIDPVGGDRFTDSLRSLKDDGRLLVIGFTAGDIPEVKVNRLLLNNIDIRGVGWGAYVMKRPGYVAAQWQELVPHLESGALAPPIGGRFPLEDAARALEMIDAREALGKVVLVP